MSGNTEEPPAEAASGRRPAKRPPRPTPAEHFKDLPVAETVDIVPDGVQAAPEAYEHIGWEETFEVDITPPQLIKRLIRRHKYKRKGDRETPPVIAPAPPRPIDGSYASAGLLAWVVISKYLDHLPLYRQERILARAGAPISRKTMAGWVEQVAAWLKPVYNYMHKELLAGDYIQADETCVKYIDIENKTGKARQGYLWVIGRPGSDVVFSWRLTRRHGELGPLIEGFSGFLQSDGYQAYRHYAERHASIVHGGCWAHARRGFYEAIEEAPKTMHYVLRLIGHLFHYEQQWDQAQTNEPNRRAALRKSHYAQTLKLLKKTVENLSRKHLPQSRIGKACTYLLNQWEPLVAHCEHGQTQIHNNLLENAIRPSAVGKKNWMFIGHPQAGERTAIIYSILISCQRHGIDPLAYLRDILTRLPRMTNQDDLRPLLPAHWQPRK